MNPKALLAASVLLTATAWADAPLTEAELIDSIVGKYYGSYFFHYGGVVENAQLGSAVVDHFRQEGVVRIMISLPDGTQKNYDFDDRFSTAKPTKIEPAARTASRLSFVFGDSTVSFTSTTYLSKYSPVAYQVWTIDKP